ncbi:hypothetical protein A8B82_14525 [Sulfitobacter sp. EhC04]|nr:hypothetical protein A8B82_14525 [Sulfitobacter sp. EhC04]
MHGTAVFCLQTMGGIFYRRRVGRSEPADLLFKPFSLRWSMPGILTFSVNLHFLAALLPQKPEINDQG